MARVIVEFVAPLAAGLLGLALVSGYRCERA